VPGRVSFYFVDVFAESPLTGNPLVVVTGAEHLDDQVRRAIAREFNQSETTFLVPPDEPSAAAWRLRSFTPAGVEVLGAGHNALGAWWWLATEGNLDAADGSGRFTQQIGDQLLPVEVVFDGSGRAKAIVMDQSAPSFGAVVEHLDPLAAALGLPANALRTDIPAQVVSTGAGHLLVPAADQDAVDRARPDSTALLAVLHAAGGEGCYVFSLDPRNAEASAYARFFNPTVGISEDPATGTAAGPLAAYLIRYGVMGDGVKGTVLVEQGYALGRPSILAVDIDGERVRLSGAGVVVAEGSLRL
jgi:PhzF family phenazine biosynthesis protein